MLSNSLFSRAPPAVSLKSARGQNARDSKSAQIRSEMGAPLHIAPPWGPLWAHLISASPCPRLTGCLKVLSGDSFFPLPSSRVRRFSQTSWSWRSWLLLNSRSIPQFLVKWLFLMHRGVSQSTRGPAAVHLVQIPPRQISHPVPWGSYFCFFAIHRDNNRSDGL